MPGVDHSRQGTRPRPLRDVLTQFFSVRSAYLFVSLAIFASLALFSFLAINTSYAMVSSMKKRASWDLPSSSAVPSLARRKSFRSLYSSVIPRRNLSLPLRPNLKSTDVPTFVVTCGAGDSDAVDEMKPLLKSILMSISSPVNFVFLTDAIGRNRIHTLFKRLAYTKRKVSVDIHILDERLVDKWAAKVRMSVWSHSSGRWGMAKLMVPWILRDREHAIIVDTDMIFMQDPMNLWELFHTDTDRGKQGWIYQMPIARLTSPIYICSCIVLLKLKKIRDHQVYPNLMRYALSQAKTWYHPEIGLYKPNTGDQGMLYMMIKHYPQLFQRLPLHWARGHCGKYQDALKVQSKLPVGILHRNCAGTNSSAVRDEASPFFDFFSHYRWHWLRPTHGTKYPVQIQTFTVLPAHIGL